ncbi:MAG: type II toxin-antitoxin system death-on-curing family toxin [Actinobacteria bacterium]|nr:type II toxin-antitoxin system death-on-curing family toxin [Actinomycetota bacterium]
MDPLFLTYDEVIRIHVIQVELYGGSHGVRDQGLLDSALAMPKAGFGDDYLHVDIFEMAAAYLYHIALNHPFVDGNKRTATHATDVFLRLNGHSLEFADDALYDLVIGVCEGTVTKKQLAAAFRENSAPFGD